MHLLALGEHKMRLEVALHVAQRTDASSVSVQRRFTQTAVSGACSSASRVVLMEQTRLRWITVRHDILSSSPALLAYDIWKDCMAS